ncbi:MAG: 23S rRNA (uracil(1939)-C(5))-methyltransferase RlmD [Desulfobacterales bacterium]|nr:23S rRNA (uracil(1939)-C(5))-methyltransferase RlmD [Desulfobacterales bacterium]
MLKIKTIFYRLTITDMAFGGKGIARVDGLAVFVDQAVPGDHVLARVVKKKKNYAEARIVELLEPSPHRIDPPCRYSGFCGGCKWQFLTYDMQLQYKRQHVVDSLEHIALIKGTPVHPVIPSEKIFEYRNKMEFSCADKRWVLPDEMDNPDIDRNFALGLHVPGTFHKVLDTEKCLLQPDLGNRILDDVRKYIKSSAFPVYGLRSHTGFWRFVMLRHSSKLDQWMVNLVTASENPEQLRRVSDLLTARYPKISSVVNNVTSRRAGIAVGEYEVRLAGEPVIKDQIGPFEFEISANSFFQTNTLQARRLYDTVKDYARLSGGQTVLDLYCGAGTIALWLSDVAREVVGIEISESAVADAENNCRRNQVSNCRFICADIQDGLARISTAPDVLVIDPPRAGMHKNVVRQVLSMAPEKIVYVSCNPATMARDIALLKDHYTVLEVQPVDMFPHTFHIESVARLILS